MGFVMPAFLGPYQEGESIKSYTRSKPKTQSHYTLMAWHGKQPIGG